MNKRGICMKRNFLLISFIFLVLISMSFVFAYCSDSDNGKDYFKKGSVSGEYKASDYCSDSKNLVEYFCENKKTDFIIFNCEGKCKNGKCISETETQTEQGFLYQLSQMPFFKFIFNIGETNLPGTSPLEQFCTGTYLALNADGTCAGAILSDCSTNGIPDNQKCIDLIPQSVREGRNDIYAACLETYWTVPSYRCDISIPPVTSSCIPSWTCSSWSSCIAGSQTRTCTDSNNCGTTTNKPATSQSCSTLTCTSASCDDNNPCTTDTCATNNAGPIYECSQDAINTGKACLTSTGESGICVSGGSCQLSQSSCVHTQIPGCSSCTPSCTGKSCGDNGCDGSCGSCSTGQICTNGQCVTGTCSKVGQVCRAAEGGSIGCDIEEKWDSQCTCPADKFKAKGTTCGDNTKPCEKDKKCTGDSSICPAEGEKVPEGDACIEAHGICYSNSKLGLSFGCWSNYKPKKKTPTSECNWELVTETPCTSEDQTYCTSLGMECAPSTETIDSTSSLSIDDSLVPTDAVA